MAPVTRAEIEGNSVHWFSFADASREEWQSRGTTLPFLRRISGREIAGVTLYDYRVVLVDAGYARAVQDETLFHEHHHVAAGPFPARLKLSEEERAVRAISPNLWTMMRRYGFRWPRRPARYGALEKLARAYHEDALRCLVWEQTHERVRVDRRRLSARRYGAATIRARASRGRLARCGARRA